MEFATSVFAVIGCWALALSLLALLLYSIYKGRGDGQ